MRWVGHVARMGDKRNSYSVLVEKPEEKSFEGLGVDRKIIIKIILEE
jgi:hypothetical protein